MSSDQTPDQPAEVDPSTRGYTTIADRAIRKIAAHAATDVAQASGAARRVLGVPLWGGPGESPAQVDVDVDGDHASVQVAMSVSWPAPVREVTRQVRSRIIEDLAAFTGLTVREVDVEVTELPGAQGDQRRRVV